MKISTPIKLILISIVVVVFASLFAFAQHNKQLDFTRQNIKNSDLTIAFAIDFDTIK